MMRYEKKKKNLKEFVRFCWEDKTVKLKVKSVSIQIDVKNSGNFSLSLASLFIGMLLR